MVARCPAITSQVFASMGEAPTSKVPILPSVLAETETVVVPTAEFVIYRKKKIKRQEKHH